MEASSAERSRASIRIYQVVDSFTPPDGKSRRTMIRPPPGASALGDCHLNDKSLPT
jgi:hypothetical protein